MLKTLCDHRKPPSFPSSLTARSFRGGCNYVAAAAAAAEKTVMTTMTTMLPASLSSEKLPTKRRRAARSRGQPREGRDIKILMCACRTPAGSVKLGQIAQQSNAPQVSSWVGRARSIFTEARHLSTNHHLKLRKGKPQSPQIYPKRGSRNYPRRRGRSDRTGEEGATEGA